MYATLIEKYSAYHKTNFDLYEARINILNKECKHDLQRYIDNSLPLFATNKDSLHYVTMDTIEKELTEACCNGVSFVEYDVHKHYYPGFRGDNVSFLTGNYYIRADGKYITIPGAPSYIKALKGVLGGGVTVTCRETENDHVILRVEIQ